MMAKMFYTLDEAKSALNKDEEEIKQYTREGRLREFRDGRRLMFKADQVEALKQELGVGGGGPPADHVDLGISDTGAPIGLVDSAGASGSQSGISLVDTGAGQLSAGGAQLREDTGLSADLGLSGSIGGMPSPVRGAGTNVPGSIPSGTVSGRSGINVLGPDESHADPMAQTAISTGATEQVSLEGVGSGSGLLDLTRESDDTSLGAELLDEIAPGGSTGTGKRASTGDTSMTGSTGAAPAIAPAATAARRGGTAVGTPIYVESADPSAGFFGGLALGGVAMLLVGLLALTGAVMDIRVAVLGPLMAYGFPVLAGIGIVVAVIFGVLGLVVGRALK
jgi:hypothetical protein